jgi:hypothetical protein
MGRCIGFARRPPPSIDGRARTVGGHAARSACLARGVVTGFVVVAAAALGAGLGGCGVDAATAAAARARDLAGPWTADDGTVLIVEEESHPSDMRATLERASAFPAEAAVLAALDDARPVAPVLTLGAGVDALLTELLGGENIVDDDGVVRLHVRTRAFGARDDPATTLRWHLALQGDDESLAGSLFVTTSSRARRPGDVDGFADEATRADVPLRFRR